MFYRGVKKNKIIIHHTSLHDSFNGNPSIRSKHDEFPKSVDGTDRSDDMLVYLPVILGRIINNL